MFGIEVVENAGIANAATPSGRLRLQAGDVAGKRIISHLNKCGLNPFAVFCGKPSEIFSCGLADDQFPSHVKARLELRNPPDQMPPAHDLLRPVRTSALELLESGSEGRNRCAAPRGPAPSGCGSPLCAPSQIPPPVAAVKKSSWFGSCAWMLLVKTKC